MEPTDTVLRRCRRLQSIPFCRTTWPAISTSSTAPLRVASASPTVPAIKTSGKSSRSGAAPARPGLGRRRSACHRPLLRPARLQPGGGPLSRGQTDRRLRFHRLRCHAR